MNERDKLASQPLSGDADLPLDVRRDLMAAATANGSISYYWLCDVYRRGRSGDADLLRQLIEKWREFAAFEVENANHQLGAALYQCADELEAALSTIQVSSIGPCPTCGNVKGTLSSTLEAPYSEKTMAFLQARDAHADEVIEAKNKRLSELAVQCEAQAEEIERLKAQAEDAALQVSSGSAQEWQPIETAPKDAEVLAFEGGALSRVKGWKVMEGTTPAVASSPLSRYSNPPSPRDGTPFRAAGVVKAESNTLSARSPREETERTERT